MRVGRRSSSKQKKKVMGLPAAEGLEHIDCGVVMPHVADSKKKKRVG
jgi:hypothetical protein